MQSLPRRERVQLQVLSFLLNNRAEMQTISYQALAEVYVNIKKAIKQQKDLVVRVYAIKIFKVLIEEQIITSAESKSEMLKYLMKYIQSVGSHSLFSLPLSLPLIHPICL